MFSVQVRTPLKWTRCPFWPELYRTGGITGRTYVSRLGCDDARAALAEWVEQSKSPPDGPGGFRCRTLTTTESSADFSCRRGRGRLFFTVGG